MSVDVSNPGAKLKINFDFTLLALSCDNFGIVTDRLLVDFNSKGHGGHYWGPATGDQRACEEDSNWGDRLQGTRVLGDQEGERKSSFILLQVRGEFHIAFGRKAEAMDGDASHIHRFTPAELRFFNCSHTINRLSFGEDFPGVVQPLDGEKEIVTEGESLRCSDSPVRSREISVLHSDSANGLRVRKWSGCANEPILRHREYFFRSPREGRELQAARLASAHLTSRDLLQVRNVALHGDVHRAPQVPVSSLHRIVCHRGRCLCGEWIRQLFCVVHRKIREEDVKDGGEAGGAFWTFLFFGAFAER